MLNFKDMKPVAIGDKKMIVFEDTKLGKKLSISEYNFDNSSLNVERFQYINIPQ